MKYVLITCITSVKYFVLEFKLKISHKPVQPLYTSRTYKMKLYFYFILIYFMNEICVKDYIVIKYYSYLLI